jgi:hypothetical protein
MGEPPTSNAQTAAHRMNSTTTTTTTTTMFPRISFVLQPNTNMPPVRRRHRRYRRKND